MIFGTDIWRLLLWDLSVNICIIFSQSLEIRPETNPAFIFSYLVFLWFLICIRHFCFRKQMQKQWFEYVPLLHEIYSQIIVEDIFFTPVKKEILN